MITDKDLKRHAIFMREHPDDFSGYAKEIIDEYRKEIRSLQEIAEVAVEVKKLVDKQAEDEFLWFIAQYASEDYLQKGLRLLHAKVECIGMFLKKAGYLK